MLLRTLENAPLQAYTGMLEETFGLEIVRFNLTEFIWSANCSIVTNHYSFQYLKAMFFSYLHVAGKGRQVWLLKALNVLDVL